MSLDASIRENEAEHLIEFDAVGIRSTWNADQWMLQGWNWKVSAGDFWLVGGPAGCGKSEILSVASGLLKPARGRLRFFGREVQDLEPESWLDERLRLGLVFEDGGRVFQELTVYENLLLPLNYHGRTKDQASHAWIMQVLESLELASMQHHVSGRLSRHWKQRLGLARALALQPEVLFMDHPLAVIDTHHAHWWVRFVRDLRAGHWEGGPRSVVIATSDLTPWLADMDRLALIKDGNWVEMDTADRSSLREDACFRSLVTDSI